MNSKIRLPHGNVPATMSHYGYLTTLHIHVHVHHFCVVFINLQVCTLNVCTSVHAGYIPCVDVLHKLEQLISENEPELIVLRAERSVACALYNVYCT